MLRRSRGLLQEAPEKVNVMFARGESGRPDRFEANSRDEHQSVR